MAESILLPLKGKKQKLKDLTGKRFGKLTALEHVASELNGGNAIWRCLCDCGNVKDVVGGQLSPKTGTRSCGCIRSEITKKHPIDWTVNITHNDSGKCRSREYISWSCMIQRCTNKNNTAYKNYGGRGIYVCQEWRDSYEAFLADMGRKPSKKHSLDRINPDAGYQKE